MRRRNFLKLAGIATLGTAALPGLGIASVSTEEALAGLIKSEFNYLQLDQEGLEQFVEDYLSLQHHSSVNKMKLRSYYLLKLNSTDSQLITKLTRNYIQSTDFFRNRMNESLPVKYIGFYNPYKTPCANPFSAFYYPDVAS